jgi:hypothetical protein
MALRHSATAVRVVQRSEQNGKRLPIGLVVVGVGFLLTLVAILAMSLNRVEPPTFAPSPLQPRPAVDRLVGPELVTVDARDPARWQFFSFATGSVVENPGPVGWDLAFRRFQVIANGGAGFAGSGGVLDLGEIPFDSLRAVPEHGYSTTTVRSDSVNAALHRWYDYSFLSHLLSPKPRTFAVRTADGRYAMLEFVGYYCPGAMPGCVTFRYLYQGAGGPAMAAVDLQPR